METKDYNVLINKRNFFDQPVKNDLRTYDNVKKITSAQRDNYTTGCLTDYLYFKEHYKLIAIDLIKLDADLKAMQQIIPPRKLDRPGNTTIYFIIEEAEKTISDISQRTLI